MVVVERRLLLFVHAIAIFTFTRVSRAKRVKRMYGCAFDAPCALDAGSLGDLTSVPYFSIRRRPHRGPSAEG